MTKNTGVLHVTYKMMFCGRSQERQEDIKNISDIQVLPIKTQYGIVGYVAEIQFKNNASAVQLYKDKGDNV